MTKLREPLSPGDALHTSIVALEPDPASGLSRWALAHRITGLSEAQLRICTLGQRPIRQDVIETIDLWNASRGGLATNLESWQERHAAALGGAPYAAGPDPARLLERAIRDTREAARALESGHGNLDQIRRLLIDLQKVQTQLFDGWSAQVDRARKEGGGEDTAATAVPAAPPRLVRNP